MADEQPLLPGQQPQPEPEQPEDLTPYQDFIKHDKYRNSIAVSKTQLLAHFHKAAPYMEDIHRKQIVDLDARLAKSYNGTVSRTAHHQVAAIVTRYMHRVQESNVELAEQLKAALVQADKIELLCSSIMEETNQSRTRGNIRFVKELVPTRKVG